MYLRSDEGFGQTPPAAAAPSGPRTFVIEQEQGRSIVPKERWNLYRDQSGPRARPWDFYVTQREYDYFVGQFEELKRKRPQDYKRAMRAVEDLRNNAGFALTYHRLNIAARSAELRLAPNGELVLNVEKKTIIELIGEAAAQEVLDELRDAGLTLVFGERLGTRLAAVLGIASILETLFKEARTQELIRHCSRPNDPVCFQRKLSLTMDVLAATLSRKRREHPASTKAFIAHQYARYHKMFQTYQFFLQQEQKLMGNLPHPGPSFRRPSRWARP